MALTSVVPAYISQQQQLTSSAELTLSSMNNAASYSSSVSIGQCQPGVATNGDATAAIILANSSHTPPSYLNSSSLPRGYFTTNTDAFQLIQPPVQSLLNTTYQTFRGYPHPGVSPQILASFSPGCLLPTPCQPNGNNNNAEAALRLNGYFSSKSNTDYNNIELNGMSDENSSVRQSTSVSDIVAQPNSQNFVLVVRLLMSGKEVGSIIGKRGENVKKYREESGARINISDGSSPERIVTITGNTDQIFTAFTLMSQKFEDDFTQGLLRMGDEALSCPPVTLRLLVPATQCGSIIGKGGSRIKEVRELTGASIQVASEALPSSTERTVTVSGTAKAIAKCIRHLCDIFIDSPAKGPVIPYRPKPAFNNSNLVCTASPFQPNVVQPPLAYSMNGTDPCIESAYPNVVLNNGVPCTPSSLSSAEVATSPTVQQNGHIELNGINATTTASDAYITPENPTSPLTVMPSGRPSAMVTDLITDSVQLPATIGCSEFAAPSMPVLNALNSSPFAAASVHSPISFPELSFNSGLIGFYATQPSPNGLTNHTTNLFYQGVPNLLRPATTPTFSTNALGIMDDNNPFSGNITDASIELKDIRACLPTMTEIYAGNPLLSLNHSNAFINGCNNLQTGANNALPVIQSKASLLGLPAFPLPFYVGSQNSPYGLPTNLNSPLTPPSDEIISRELIISNDLIGCIIGRGGTTVNEIRNISKAQVKISNCEDGAKERKITLCGPVPAVNLAQFLINNSILAHQQMWAFNVQLASAATALMVSNNQQLNFPVVPNNVINGRESTEKQQLDPDCLSIESSYFPSQSNSGEILNNPQISESIFLFQDATEQNTNGTKSFKPNYKSSTLLNGLKRHRINCAPY